MNHWLSWTLMFNMLLIKRVVGKSFCMVGKVIRIVGLGNSEQVNLVEVCGWYVVCKGGQFVGKGGKINLFTITRMNIINYYWFHNQYQLEAFKNRKHSLANSKCCNYVILPRYCMIATNLENCTEAGKGVESDSQKPEQVLVVPRIFSQPPFIPRGL